MSDKLLPCPFCGAPGFLMLAAFGFKIKCTDTDCTVETPIRTHNRQVIAIWNRRALSSPQAPDRSDEARAEPPDIIARCKRIMALVDAYVERPTPYTRGDIRVALMDEFGAGRASAPPQQPEPARPDLDRLHATIMNIQPPRTEQGEPMGWSPAYLDGHRDARHAAAELVLASAPSREGPQALADKCDIEALTDKRGRFENYMRKQNPCVRLARHSAGTAYRTVSVERAWQLWRAALEGQQSPEPVAWIRPSDLAAFATQETTAVVASVKFGTPEEVSVPLYASPQSSIGASTQAEEALRWLEANLFEHKWDGTLGRPSTWYVRGDYRHTMQRLKGESLVEAVRAAMAEEGRDHG